MAVKSPDPTLADPRLHRALGAMVRRRVPETDADDIVQSALTEALASQSAPDDAESLRKWIFTVAKNKIADYYRKRRREQPTEAIDVAAEETPYSERDLLRWAERQLPPGSDSPKTLEWMLREGEGEKLESIALDEKVPAPRVRQRVSRMRRFLKERWLTTAVLGAVTVVAILLVLYALKKPRQPDLAVPEPPHSTTVPQKPRQDDPLELAKKDRAAALEACDRSEWSPCIDGLDRAAKVDPAGDGDARVKAARQAAAKALAPPAPVPTPSAVPSPPRSTTPGPTATPRPTSTSTTPFGSTGGSSGS